jgi:hypothetical protein
MGGCLHFGGLPCADPCSTECVWNVPAGISLPVHQPPRPIPGRCCLCPPVLVSPLLYPAISRMANPALPRRYHTTVLEMVHLAKLLALPASPESPLSVLFVSWRFDLCLVGLGFLTPTINPNQHSVNPKSSPTSLLHPWPTTPTAEEETMLHSPSLFHGSTDPASHSTKSRGAVVHAPDLLGCTTFGSLQSSWC